MDESLAKKIIGAMIITLQKHDVDMSEILSTLEKSGVDQAKAMKLILESVAGFEH